MTLSRDIITCSPLPQRRQRTRRDLLKSKKKKVEIDLNTKFANIEAIRKAQLAAGAVREESSQSETTDDDEALEDCILVG